MDQTPEQQLGAIEKQLAGFRIIGGDGVNVRGSMSQGYAVEIKRGPSASGEVSGFTGPTGPTGPPTGDCPLDISILCESVSASKSKCGFSEFAGFVSVPPKLYLRFDQSYFETDNGPSCHISDPLVTCAGKSIFNYGYWEEYDPSDCSFSSDPGPAPDRVNTFCDGSTSFVSGGGGRKSATPTSSTTASKFLSFSVNTNPLCVPVPQTHTETTTQILSSEYTTAVLISTAEADLPDYEDDFSSGGCSASRTLADNESSYAISRFRYKFTFSSVTNDFTLTWKEHTEFDDLTSSDNLMSAFISAGQTESGIFECLEPSENGVTTITDVECTPA